MRQEGWWGQSCAHWEHGRLLLGGDTQPTWRVPSLYSRDSAHSTFPPQIAMETSVQENKVRQMEFPFQKAPLPGFHDSHPGPLASEGLRLHQAAGGESGEAPGSSCPGLLGGLGLGPHPLRPQSPHLNSVTGADPLVRPGNPWLLSVGSESREVRMPSSLPIPQVGGLRWREGGSTQ